MSFKNFTELQEKKIKAFYIAHYCILAVTVIIDVINTRIANWLYKEYNALDMFLWKYELITSIFIIPFFFFAMIVLLVKKKDKLKGNEKALAGFSIPLDIFIGFYTLALYAARF